MLKLSLELFIAKNESRQLNPKKTDATPVISSIKEVTLNPEAFIVDITTNENPSRFVEAPTITDDFSVAIFFRNFYRDNLFRYVKSKNRITKQV